MLLHERGSQRGFTLLELLGALGVMALLAMLLFPVLSQARRQGRRVTCLSNLRQLGQALELYQQDWGQYPLQGWVDTREVLADVEDPLKPYTKQEDLYHCPESHRLLYDYRAAFDVEGDGNYKLFQVEANSVIAACQHQLETQKAGKPRGFYQVLRENRSVTRIDATSVVTWEYRAEKWQLPDPSVTGDESAPALLVFPGEPFPLPFLNP